MNKLKTMHASGLKCGIRKLTRTTLTPLIMLIGMSLHASASDVPPTNDAEKNKHTISGFIKDAETGEELIGATIRVDEIGNGTITNPYGFYSLTLEPGTYHISFTYIGYATVKKEIVLDQNKEINVELSSATTDLEEVVITGKALDANVQDISMSKVDVNIVQLKKLPALFGEPDIIKAIQMMPGVISAGEGTTGYFVRGGSSDQNLILIDEAPVYDASHLFGLFSVFNSDVIKSADLYKGGIPAQYGGRLSSLLDVRTRDGNNKKFEAHGGLGTLASRLTLEGPLVKDKSSFIVAGRRSYLDVFQRMSGNSEVNSNLISFYDLNAKVNFKPNNKNRFFVAGYFGRDKFTFGDDAAFDWGNGTLSFRWNHLFSDQLFSNATFIVSNFDYKLEIKDPSNALEWTANLQEAQLKFDFSYFINPNNELRFGYHGGFRRFSPGRIAPNTPESIFEPYALEKMYAFDHGAYISNDQRLSSKLSLQYGLRASIFQNVGDTEIREYLDPQDNITIIYEPHFYEKFELIKSFRNLEPRFSARYLVSESTSLKLSYNRMVQNIHLMSNSTVPVPFNTWQPSSPYLNPQYADQIAGGYFKNFKENMFEFSAEVYYKWMKDVPDFADNATIFFNPDIATEFRPGEGTSYGLELYLKKNTGKFTGSAAYTLSKTEWDIPDINMSRPFAASYDRLHNLSLVGTYELNDKWALGASWIYSTGRPITIPAGRYEYDGFSVDYITARNDYRMPDVHRLDLSATLTPRKNNNRKWHGSWVFSIYNAYNNKNPFTIYTSLKRDDDGNLISPKQKQASMVYLFPILPSVTYNFNF